MRFTNLLAASLLFTSLLASQISLAQKVKSVPFSYLPEKAEDRYNQRVTRKMLPLPAGGFIILAHKAGTDYAVERYDADLKLVWTAAVPVAAGESIEAFSHSPEQAWVIVHHKDEASQNLTALPIDLRNGQKGPLKKLVEAAARDRRPSIAISPDGTRLVAYRYLTREVQIKAISASIYDQKLTKLKDRTYDFHDLGDFFSPTVFVANDGTQYATLVSDQMKKLTVRRYRNDNPDIKVMSVAVGGTFGGKAVTVFDSRFTLQPDNMLYAAAICNERESGLYYSLKVVKFDFIDKGDMKFAPEFRFTPEYLAEVNKATQASAKRLEDVYISDLLLTEEKQLVVVAEKKYEEGGDESPVHARELHLFGYNEFQSPSWHRIIAKDQVAPPTESFTGIGYRAAVFGPEIQILTQEKLNGKSDLYVRRVDARTGATQPAKALGLTVAADQNLAYVKDFTGWLDAKTIIGVSRPSKKSAALMLNKIVVK
ncbi:hypothetical protein SAMN02745146_0453 [Hymenobacter daecheongensis DSM 21074]|uniref:S9 family peptidase n=1 Tax=Hymenobacter daecheongensis DSM 21074 TaxID=1121955 RepID=A0A1M6A1N4_9BACT|nr:hypothetical protein [Hymenobacter daecheongensis]SHI30414.1 hypothetical protein SAMN02745146_0453 [Hymenobacter daecheongensis DSM 21074]